jgi:PAS domain S-box-containing protein
MGKVRSLTVMSLMATLFAVVAIALAAYLDAFESLGAWIRQLEPGQLGELLAISIVLTAVLGFYCWRGWARLRRQTTRHERQIARLEGEVAELRRAREALQRDTATYRRVIANLPVALFAVDHEGVFTFSEGKGLELLGFEPDRVVGRSIFETYRDASQVMENVRLALGGQASGTIVEVGGREVETRFSPLRENGQFSGVLGLAIDVTERRLAEDRLREAEARYRTLVEQIPAITYVEELSRNGKALAYVSPQYEAKLGYSPEEGILHLEHWLDVVHPEDRESVLAEDKRTDETLEPFMAEYRVIAKDGRIVWVRDEAVLVRDESGEPLFWQGVMHDITERVGAEEALRESERRLSTLLANAPAYLYRCRNEPGWPNEFVSDYALRP